MRQKKRKFHVVQEGEVKALPAEDGEDGLSIEELEEQIRAYRKKMRRRGVIAAVLLIFAVTTISLVISLQTYTEARTIDTYAGNDAANSSYREFSGGILKYSRDGVAFLNKSGEELWNRPYQIQSPVVETFQDSAIVADKGGNTIIVFGKEGEKGEIETTLPVEKAVVSAQGIVSAIVKGDGDPRIVCYDAAGNVLAEIATSLEGTGYPLDISLSENGELLMVSYMTVQGGRVNSNIYYYSFGKEGDRSENYEVVTDTYKDLVAPSVFFMDDTSSAVVAGDRVMIYKGKKVPELNVTIQLEKEIKSSFYSDDYIGLVLKNEGEEGYELCLYNTRGKKVMSEKFSGDYSRMKISGSQVILYDGKKCRIFTRGGVCRFDGEMKDSILEIVPVFGVNKYMVMNANGMEIVRLVK